MSLGKLIVLHLGMTLNYLKICNVHATPTEEVSRCPEIDSTKINSQCEREKKENCEGPVGAQPNPWHKKRGKVRH